MWSSGITQLGSTSGAAATTFTKAKLPPPRVEVYVRSEAPFAPDELVRYTRGPKSDDPVVERAAQNGLKVYKYYAREFGRSGISGRGEPLHLLAHAPDPMNARWYADEGRIWLGDGDPQFFKPLGTADDVIAHEFAHGVIESEVEIGYTGQQGAVHESFSDVLAMGVDDNWRIGEDAVTKEAPFREIRDLANLTYTSLDKLPANDDDVHRASEVLSHAAYQFGSAHGPESMRKVWYAAVVDHLEPYSGFSDARDATLAAATTAYGPESAELRDLANAWRAVGIIGDIPQSLTLADATRLGVANLRHSPSDG